MNSNLAYRGISCELRPVEEVCVNQDSNDTVSGVYVLCELCVCVYMLWVMCVYVYEELCMCELLYVYMCVWCVCELCVCVS